MANQSAVPTDDALITFIEALQSIDTDSLTAVLNATSMSDNNGGRILF